MKGFEVRRYNSFATGKGNTVWAAAMCFAWSELITSFVKEPIALNVHDQEAKRIIANYNAQIVTTKDVSPESIYIKSGMGQKTVDLINKEVFEKFPEKSMPKLDIHLNPLDIISYAYLLKKLTFEFRFQRNKEKSFLFSGKYVQSFKTTNKDQKKQIHCLQYQDKQNFTIFLKDKKNADLLYFIKSQKPLTIDEAIDRVLAHKPETFIQKLGKSDYFEMPVVDLSCKRTVKELIGKPFLNESMKEYLITEMFQGVKLKIDEEGARVENEAVMIATRMCAFEERQPKVCILNKDFWIVMREQGKHPYLCVHLTNPEDNE